MFRLFYKTLIAVMISGSCSGQSRTFIGAEIAYSEDHYQVFDPGGLLAKAPLNAALLGITVRHLVSPHLYLETGIYTREYREGLAFKNEISFGGSGRRVGQLPLRIGGNWGFFNDRIFIRPVTGLILNVAGNGQPGSSWGGFEYPPIGGIMQYEYRIRYQTQVFFLAQAGLSVDVRLGQKFFLGLSANHCLGLQKILIQDVKYGIGNQIFPPATTYTNGDYSSVGLSCSYRFGK